MAAQDVYETPARKWRGILDSLFGWSTVWFYIRLFSIFIYAATKGKLLGYSNRYWANDSLSVMNLVENCGGRLRIEGLHNLRGLTRPVVFTANHMSMLETLLAAGLIVPSGVTLTVVMKLSLMKYPVFGPIVKSLNPIGVGRTDPKEDLLHVLKDGADKIRSGISLLIFPQSTRSTGFEPAKFNSLGVKLARNTGALVIPVALKTDFVGIGSVNRDLGPLDRSKTIHFRFGPPLEVTGNGRETQEKVVSFIGSTLKEWGATVITGDDATVAAEKPTSQTGNKI